MQIKPLKDDLEEYLIKHGLVRKFDKQKEIFLRNPRHPSLNTEALNIKSPKIYSFRVDRKYRAIFILPEPGIVEIVDINNHYQ